MADKRGLRQLDKMFEAIRLEKQEEHMQKVHRKDSTSCEAHGPHAAFRRPSTSSSSSRKGSLSEPPATRRSSTTSTKRPSLSGSSDLGMATTYGFGFSGAGARRESLAAKTSGWRDITSPPRKDSTASVSSLRRFSVDSLDSRRDSLDLGIAGHVRRDSLSGGGVLDDGTILEEEEVNFPRSDLLTTSLVCRAIIF